jgi:hypothetical protein
MHHQRERRQERQTPPRPGLAGVPVTVGGTLEHGIVSSAEEASPAEPAVGEPWPDNSEVTELVTAVLPAVDYNRMT